MPDHDLQPPRTSLISIAEAAAIMRRSVSSVDRDRRAGRLHTFRIGSRVYVDRDEVERLMAPVPDCGGCRREEP